MMLVMDATPAEKREDREDTRQQAQPHIETLIAEKSAVAALVEDYKPLNQTKTKSYLSQGPEQ